MNVSKALLKTEIDELDEHYLELLYNIIRQFPHRPPATKTKKQTLRTHPAFGSWRSRGIDAVAYQQRLRAEWE